MDLPDYFTNPADAPRLRRGDTRLGFRLGLGDLSPLRVRIHEDFIGREG